MKKYTSELMKSLHEEADYFHGKGVISDAEMKEYDKDCLVSKTDTPVSAAGRPPLAATGTHNRNSIHK